MTARENLLLSTLKLALCSQWLSIDHEHNRTRQACAIRTQMCAAVDAVEGAEREDLNIAVIRAKFADSIEHDEKGYYYENADMPPDRFYFNTWEEAAADLAVEIGVTDEERAAVECNPDVARIRTFLETYQPWEGADDPVLAVLEAFNRLHPESRHG